MTPITVDASFPGGNIVVEGISGDDVRLRQDLRDTTTWWFYWCLRVRHAAGRTLRFHFTNQHVFGPAGPCYSPDGIHWHWLGRGCINGDTFIYTFGPKQQEGYFAFCPTYTEAHIRRFLRRHPHVQQGILTMSEQGRAVECLMIRAATPRMTMLVTARHHACESVSSYVLEGILAAWGEGCENSAWLRKYIDLYAVPFVDKDGVENGDQGKMRAPHDHWQDYTDAPRYKSVRAVQLLCKELRVPLGLSLDLHCPWIRGTYAEAVLQLDPEPPLQELSNLYWRVLADCGASVVSQMPVTRIPYGFAWNLDMDDCATYLRRHYHALAITLEFPYACANDVLITAEEAQAFGGDLVYAAARHFQQMT